MCPIEMKVNVFKLKNILAAPGGELVTGLNTPSGAVSSLRPLPGNIIYIKFCEASNFSGTLN